jgi:hypothetical protein
MTTPPKLLGRYQTPAFKYGDVVTCARRGDVRIVGLSEAPIPWPVGQRLPRSISRSLVLYGDLAEAVRGESAEAVMHFWGVRPSTVWQWRKALGVGQYTEGTRRLKSETLSPVLGVAREASRATWRCPRRRAKLSAALSGKRRPAHVIEAIRKGRIGKHHSAQTREKLSLMHRRRGTLVPGTKLWTAEEDDLVRTLPPKEAAETTGRTLTAVYARRRAMVAVRKPAAG